MNIKDEFKRKVNKIKPNKKVQKNIYKLIINKNLNRKKVYLKNAFACSFLVIFCVFSIAYADEIKKSFNTLKINYREKTKETNNFINISSDALIELNYDANIPETMEPKMDTTYTYAELEKILGVKLLKSTYFKNNAFYNHYTKKENNKIALTKLGIKDLMSSNTLDYNQSNNKLEKFNMMVTLKTKYLKDNVVRSWFSNVDTEEYYINSLKTSSIIIKIGEKHYITILDYDNIQYQYEFMFMGFDYLDGEINSRIKQILDSLSY